MLGTALKQLLRAGFFCSDAGGNGGGWLKRKTICFSKEKGKFETRDGMEFKMAGGHYTFGGKREKTIEKREGAWTQVGSIFPWTTLKRRWEGGIYPWQKNVSFLSQYKYVDLVALCRYYVSSNHFKATQSTYSFKMHINRMSIILTGYRGGKW